MGDGVAGVFGTGNISSFFTGIAAGSFIGGVFGYLLGRKLGESEKEKIIWATGQLKTEDALSLNNTLRPLLEGLIRNLNDFELEGLPGKIGELLERDLLQYGLLQSNPSDADLMGYKRLASPSLISLMPSKFTLSETGIFELFHSYFDQRQEIKGLNRAAAVAFVTCLYNVCRTLTLCMQLLCEYPGKQAAAAITHCHDALLAFLKNVDNNNDLTGNMKWSLGSLFGKQRKTLVAALPLPCERFRDTLLALQQEKGVVECGKLAQMHYRALFTNSLELLLRLTDIKACQAAVPMTLEKISSGVLYYDTAETDGKVALNESMGVNRAIRYAASYWLKKSPANVPISDMRFQDLRKAMLEHAKEPEQRAWLEELAQITYLCLLASKFEQAASAQQFTRLGYQKNQNGSLIRLRMLSGVLLQAVQPRIHALFALPDLQTRLLTCQQPKALQGMGAYPTEGEQFLERAEAPESPLQRIFGCKTTVTNAPLFKPMQALVKSIEQQESVQKIGLELLTDTPSNLEQTQSTIIGNEALYGYATLLAHAPDKAKRLFPDMHHKLERLFRELDMLVKRIGFNNKPDFIGATPTLTLDGESQSVSTECALVFKHQFKNDTTDALILGETGQFMLSKPPIIDAALLPRLDILIGQLKRGIDKAVVTHPRAKTILGAIDPIEKEIRDFRQALRDAPDITIGHISEELTQARDENNRLAAETRALSGQIRVLSEQNEASQTQLDKALQSSTLALQEAREAQNALTTMCTKLLEEFEIQLQLIENMKNELQQACSALSDEAAGDSGALRNGIEQLERKIDEELTRLAERTKSMAMNFKTQSAEVQNKFQALSLRLEEQTDELSKLKLQLKDALQKLQILEAQSKRLQMQPKQAFLRINGLQDICKKLEKSAKKLSFFHSSRPVKEDNLLSFVTLLLDNKDLLYSVYQKTPQIWQNQKDALLSSHMVNYSRGLTNTSTSRAVFAQILRAFEQNRLEEALSNEEILYHGQPLHLRNEQDHRFIQYQTKSQALAF